MVVRTGRIYATCLFEAGRPEESVALLEEMLFVQEENHGRDVDHATLSARLADVLSEVGREDEAEAMYLEAIETMEGEGLLHHDDLQVCRHNLAVLYARTGRLQEALELELAVVDVREDTLGLAHPDSRGSLNNLVGIYRGLGRPADEERILRQKLAACEDAFGRDAWQATNARRELAGFLVRMDRPEEAAALERP